MKGKNNPKKEKATQELGDILSEKADKINNSNIPILMISTVLYSIFLKFLIYFLLASNNFFFSSLVRLPYPDCFILSRIRSISSFDSFFLLL